MPLADERRPLAVAWLALGLAALVASGIFSLLLVAARTPFLAPLFPVADFFHVALVVHVDLSVLVWFAACAGLVWTVNGERRLESLGWAALAFAAVGTVLMSAAPFLGRGQPVMSNYVPVLDDPLFLAGLVVFGVGFAGVTLRALAAPARVGRALDGVDAQRFGLNAAAVSAAIALAAFAWSWLALPDRLDGQRYYELLFWGGGHVLQFTWTLADARRVALALDPRRPAAAARPARGGAPLRRRARRGVRDAGDLSRLAGDFARAPAAPHLADAVRRRARDPAARRSRSSSGSCARDRRARKRVRCARRCGPRLRSSRPGA